MVPLSTHLFSHWSIPLTFLTLRSFTLQLSSPRPRDPIQKVVFLIYPNKNSKDQVQLFQISEISFHGDRFCNRPRKMVLWQFWFIFVSASLESIWPCFQVYSISYLWPCFQVYSISYHALVKWSISFQADMAYFNHNYDVVCYINTTGTNEAHKARV